METGEGAGETTALPSTTAADLNLSEDLALALVKRRDLSSEVLERLGKSVAAMKSRKLRLAVVRHPKTPRHVALLFLRRKQSY
jgi:hypothetical protein